MDRTVSLEPPWRLNDRLHKLRLNEHYVFTWLEIEFVTLLDNWEIGTPATGELLVAGHDCRISMARELAMVLEKI